MTLSSTTVRQSYSGDGSTVAFPFSQGIVAVADLIVLLRSAAGVETLQAMGADYDVTGTAVNGAYPNGVTVTMHVAPIVGASLILIRDPALVQDMHLIRNGALPVDQIELRLDKLTMFVQRIRDLLSRSVTLPDSYLASWNPKLPAVLTAGTLIGINTTGDGLALVTQDSAAVSAYAPVSGGMVTDLFVQTALDNLNPRVTGSKASPVDIVAVSGISAIAAACQQTQFVRGSGGAVNISSSPQISAGTRTGQRLLLVGCSDTNTVLLENGTGLLLNGPCTLVDGSTIELFWDLGDSLWKEISRNDI